MDPTRAIGRWARAVSIVAAVSVPPVAASAATGGPPDLGPYLVGSDAMQDSDFATAANGLLTALAADPRDAALRRRAFLACALSGRPEALRLASGLPGDAAAAMMVANAAAISGRWGEARAAYAALPHDNGVADLMRPLLVAWSEAGAGLYDQALARLLPLAEGDHLPGLFALHAAMIADLAGRTGQAASLFHQAQAESGGVSLDLVRLVASFAARHGRPAEATALVTSLVRASGEFAIAAPSLDASLDRRLVTGARDGIARAYLAIGSFMASAPQSQDAGQDADQAGGQDDAGTGRPAPSQGASVSALLMLRYALSLSPGFDEARLAIADVEQTLGDAPAALASLRAVPVDDPLSPLVRLREAQVDAVSGDRAAALVIYDELTDRMPSLATPWRERGELLNDMGRYAAAVASFDRAIADTTSPGGDDWPLFFDRAVALDRSGRFAPAEADLRHALALSPEQPYVLNYLGYSYAEQGRNLDEAHRMLARAIDQKPEDGAFLDSLGWIELQQGQTVAALATLQQAAELTPEDPVANYHLGVAYWQAGRKVEARQEWQRALILAPDASERPKIEARLREAAAEAGAGAPDRDAAAAERRDSP